MTDLPELDSLRIAPYAQVSASELAGAVAARRGAVEAPHTAAIAPAVSIPRSFGKDGHATWQHKLLRYDKGGPGFVGQVLDAKSLIASLVPTRVETRKPDGSWVPTDDPIAHAAARQMGNSIMALPELVETWYRSLDGVGECWVYFTDGPNGPEVNHASIRQVEWIGSGPGAMAAILMTPDQNKNSPDVLRIPATRIMRSWVPHREWPGLATSAWERAMPDIERYIATRRSIVRVLNSRLVTNGILHFHIPTTAPTVQPNTPGATSVPTQILDYSSIVNRAITNDDDVATVAPFPMWGEKAPEWIEIGRMLDPEALAAEVAALKAVGRSINFPVQLLVEGPGVGNHWSDIFLNETFLKEDVASTLNAVYRDLTIGPYRRLLGALYTRYGHEGDPNKFRLWYDLSEIAKRPDDTAEILDMWAAGLISAKAARRRLNVAEDEAPSAAEIALKNRGVGGTRVSTNQSPSAPKTQRAAVSAPVDINTVTDELNGIDDALFIELDSLAQESVASIVVAAGAAALAVLHPTDPLRPVLASLPPEQVWSAAPPHVRSQVDIASVVAAEVPAAEAQAEHHLSSAVLLIVAVFLKAGMDGPSGLGVLVAAGVASFVAGLTFTIATKLRQAGHAAQVARGGRWAPTSVARNAMEAAAGAVPTRDPDGFPQLPDGSWVGGFGPATGPAVTAVLLEEMPGAVLEYEWQHGDPPHPFDPHRRLDGETFTAATRTIVCANPSGFPGPVLYPGDHDGCTCRTPIRLVPA